MVKGYKPIRDWKCGEIHMRDPFVFTDKRNGRYLLFGTSLPDGAGNREPVFEVFESSDLITWRGPYIAFDPPRGFFGVKNFWAPEVHYYNGAFYMFASVKGGIGTSRCSCIFRSALPEGPYLLHNTGTITLEGSECLDATFYVDADGQPWTAFCHEWTELYYGKILARKLKPDLSGPLDKDIITIVDTERDIKRGELPWIRKMMDPRIQQDGYLTDAPFFYRTRAGELLMLWSSYSNKDAGYFGGYTVAFCRSESGSMEGPWLHERKLMLDWNAGHASIFLDLDGNMKMCLHAPDTPHGFERPCFLPLTERDGALVVV